MVSEAAIVAGAWAQGALWAKEVGEGYLDAAWARLLTLSARGPARELALKQRGFAAGAVFWDRAANTYGED